MKYFEKGWSSVKTLSINIPDNLAAQINDYVKAGIFSSEPDVILAAMSEFVRRNRVDMMERFAREDIEWAKKEALGPKWASSYAMPDPIIHLYEARCLPLLRQAGNLFLPLSCLSGSSNCHSFGYPMAWMAPGR